MNTRFWGAVLIFLSAYSPLSVIFIVQDIQYKDGHLYFNHPFLTFGYLLVSIVSCIILIGTVKSLISGGPPATIIKVSKRSGELINYSIPYMISFFVVDLGAVRTLLSFGFFMILMFWVTYKTHNIFINPILACLGYNLYDVTYKQNNQLHDAYIIHKGNTLFPDDVCRLAEVSEQLFLCTELNKEI